MFKIKNKKKTFLKMNAHLHRGIPTYKPINTSDPLMKTINFVFKLASIINEFELSGKNEYEYPFLHKVFYNKCNGEEEKAIWDYLYAEKYEDLIINNNKYYFQEFEEIFWKSPSNRSQEETNNYFDYIDDALGTVGIVDLENCLHSICYKLIQFYINHKYFDDNEEKKATTSNPLLINEFKYYKNKFYEYLSIYYLKKSAKTREYYYPNDGDRVRNFEHLISKIFIKEIDCLYLWRNNLNKSSNKKIHYSDVLKEYNNVKENTDELFNESNVITYDKNIILPKKLFIQQATGDIRYTYLNMFLENRDVLIFNKNHYNINNVNDLTNMITSLYSSYEECIKNITCILDHLPKYNIFNQNASPEDGGGFFIIYQNIFYIVDSKNWNTDETKFKSIEPQLFTYLLSYSFLIIPKSINIDNLYLMIINPYNTDIQFDNLIKFFEDLHNPYQAFTYIKNNIKYLYYDGDENYIVYNNICWNDFEREIKEIMINKIGNFEYEKFINELNRNLNLKEADHCIKLRMKYGSRNDLDKLNLQELYGILLCNDQLRIKVRKAENIKKDEINRKKSIDMKKNRLNGKHQQNLQNF